VHSNFSDRAATAKDAQKGSTLFSHTDTDISYGWIDYCIGALPVFLNDKSRLSSAHGA